MASFNLADLDFILAQIRLSEAHAAGTPLTDLLPNGQVPFGLRTVDGSWNNIDVSTFGSADHLFPRLVPAQFRPAELGTSYQQTSGTVFDSQPRTISNLIVDQTNNNPAASAAAAGTAGSQMVTSPGLDGQFGTADDKAVNFIPNVTADAGLTAPFNSWMTFFGQFFDHGLDLVSKGGNGVIFIPLKPDDPLYVQGGQTNFMVLTRATMQAGADGVLGTADDVHEHTNNTSPFVDQNQTYSSHPSHQVFLREYALVDGKPVATGHLIENRDLGADGKFGTADDVMLGGMATWKVVKAQARDVLGIELEDADVVRVPLLATDAYGNFTPGAHGFPQLVTPGGLVEGNLSTPADASAAFGSGHGFLDDIAHNAVPLASNGALLVADADHVVSSTLAAGQYDNELLDAHYIAGDGRVNENIGLTTVHHVFHAEHNRLVEQTKQLVLSSGKLSVLSEWLQPGSVPAEFPTSQAEIDALHWNGERLFQAGRFGTEMQYQHLVFEEFARTVQPQVDGFLAPNGYDRSIDPSIVAEFAHTVYRFGHSMLTETIDRYDAQFNNSEIGLIAAFLNPLEFAGSGATARDAAGAIIRGVTRQVGNEIDEFVTEALRSNLLGLPLDLPALNIARARDAGVPTLNEARRKFYDMTGDEQLRPYTSWADMVQYLKHPESLVNFIAAYGTHASITGADTLAAKRAAAAALVLGGEGAPLDRLDFLNGTGSWASGANGVTSTGLDKVDFWIGGLAEEKMPFGGMLGSTFNFVFETQLEALQNGDRFYYLSRTAGLHFGTELENNSFAKLVMENTSVTHLNNVIFQTPTYTLEVDQSRQFNSGLGHADPTGGTLLTPLVMRDDPSTSAVESHYLKYTGEDHVVMGGTAGNDIIIAGDGDDTLYGDGGNDRLEGGYGNDAILGGAGDDIIQDMGGDDRLEGGAGNDVIQAGNMMAAGAGNLILGGDGKDFIITTEDISTTFGGQGDDFILGAKTNLPPTGNEGDDWIERGTQDGAPGDNFSPLLLDEVLGNDIFIGGGGFDEMIGEGGDDIFVGSDAQDKMDGMSGFDWVTYKNDKRGVTADLKLPTLAQPHGNTPNANTGVVGGGTGGILDRFAEVEGLSGSAHADILKGDDVDAVTILNHGGATGGALTNVALIQNLQALLGAGATGFATGNIILGGDGSDIIEGRGGDDLIDGDKWLNVRISVRQNVDGTGPEIRSVNSMVDLIPDMIAGRINPGQLVAVREIVNGNGGFDTAVFSGNIGDYVIEFDDRGTATLADDILTVTDLVAGRDGVDRLSNIERMQFADTSFTYSGNNFDPVGTLEILDAASHAADATPTVGQQLTVSIAGVTDADNAGAGAVTGPVSYYWQVEQVPGSGLFSDIALAGGAEGTLDATGLKFAVTADLVGLSLRVKAIYSDAHGVSETVFSAPTIAVAAGATPPAPAALPPDDVAPGGKGIQFVRSDLAFILDQIKLAEAHAGGADLSTLLPNIRMALGLRTVDGSFNNLENPQFGAADNVFPRVAPPVLNQAENNLFGPPTPTSYQQTSGNVFDSQPRTISNLIVDQTNNNPAAVAAAAGNAGSHTVTSPGLDGIFGTADDKQVNFIPNEAPDAGLSAPFNSWMTFFGQFFDHGLDLVAKGGNGTVFIPLKPDDPLYVPGGQTNFMVLTRATMQPGADGVLGTADDVHEQSNTTSPFVDQNQTYSSHPSQQVFLRAYHMVDGKPKATGELIVNRDLGADGKYGTGDDTVLNGMATWKVVKAQARDVLGIDLTDEFVGRVPLLATDPYGNFIAGPNGYPQVVTKGVDGLAGTADDVLVEGNPAAPVSLANAVFTGHGFLEDIAHDATPFASNGALLLADANDQAGGPLASGQYDNELLDAHYIAGDGRVNENIGLTAVHHIFHSEHNRLVAQTKQLVLMSNDMEFLKEWVLPGSAPASFPVTAAEIDALVWNGERLFQAAKFGTEMQYQHLVFEEFARTIQPNVDLFFAPTQVYDVDLDASIVAEFAHTVYRFGHSMLTETIDRVNEAGVNNEIGLIAAFLNPLEFAAGGTAEQAAGAIVRGVTRQVGNEIDEFVTEALRNNLLGLPLDLAAINLARGRDVGIPSLNAVRRMVYEQTGDSQLKPYSSWADMVQYLKHPESIVNFVAAYGTHSSITGATTMADKRAAAMDLIFAGAHSPADRLDFLNSTGAWASNANGVTTTGLDKVELWIGGLAEEKMPFGGMLGSTFNFIFENQLEKLQDGDRFYYLERTAGLSFNAELESNSFAKLIMANTTATHLPGVVFTTPGFTLEVNQAMQYNPGMGNADPVGDDPLQPLVSRDNPATVGPDSNYLKYSGDQHVVLGGTAGNDILISSEGDDTLWGDEGDDRIEGGYGNDQLRGGAGDDIITDMGGDDNIQGGDGNDVIQGGNGINLIIGGMGNDFIVTGEDASEAIGGHGNDFILGGKANEQDMGNEGDDWIEGGTSDGAPGDNFDPLGMDTVIGNDVFIGRGENDKFNAEGGDDIMVGSTGMGDRYIGGSGYDWATFKDDAKGVYIDLTDRFFDQPAVPGSGASVLTRFDFVEGLSGSSHADVLIGDNADATAIQGAGAQGSVLKNIALIDGLQEFLGAGVTSFDAGNIILGGAGSDVIQGGGGDDLIDGDKWLNVRISVRANQDGTGPEIKTVDSMVDLVNDMLAGTYKVSQLVIVRELKQAAGPDFDTAVFTGLRTDYQVTIDNRGTADTSDDIVTVADTVAARDGSDRLTHIERLRFADGEQVLVNGLNASPVGNATLSDSTPTVGQTITASLAGVVDTDGISGPVAWFWQVETAPGSGLFEDLLAFDAGEVSRVDGPSFTVTPDVGGLAIRARAVYKDAHGVLEEVVTATSSAVNNAPVGTVTISDTTPTEGAALAVTAALTDADGIASPFSYQWQMGNGVSFSNIPGASGSSFTPGQLQVNQMLRVVVSYTDALGNLESFTSAATAVVGDLVIGTNNADTLNGTAGSDNLQGRNGNDILNGLAGNDVLFGENGNDTLDGGLGADTMSGGLNNDTYIVDHAGDVVVEAANSGTDTVRSSLAAYALAANVENLVITGAAATVSGNALDNIITSGAGNDTMAGGAGNDTYVVNNAGDVVVEAAGQGTDLVRTALTSWTLAANVENLMYTGGAAGFTGTGNVTSNTIWGGDGNDVLDGGASADRLIGNGGNDTLIGGTGADTMEGGSGDDSYQVDNAGDVVTELAGGGTDSVQVSLASYTLAANVENMVFTGSGNFSGTGNALNNHMTGGSGNDTLNGGAGADLMEGGAGNDLYVVDNAGDVVVEAAGGGVDQIQTSLLNFSLGNFIENLRYTGNGDFTGNGNSTSNTIWGNGGNDFLSGGASADSLIGNGGDDILDGGTGNDTLNGGAGNDMFLFSGAFGQDTIVGFDPNPAGGGQDKLNVAALGINAGNFNAQVSITQVGVDTRIAIGTNSITLLGIDDAEVTINDFVLS